jgi:hypothetical protein
MRPGQPLASAAREAIEAATRPRSNPGPGDRRSPGRQSHTRRCSRLRNGSPRYGPADGAGPPRCRGRADRRAGAGVSQPLQARCAATGHGDHGDAVRRQRPDGQPARYPSQGRGHQDCSLNSPPGSRSCHYRGLEQRRCYHQTVTRRARAQDMSSRAGQCPITWKRECLSVVTRTRRRSICASRNPSSPSVTVRATLR